MEMNAGKCELNRKQLEKIAGAWMHLSADWHQLAEPVNSVVETDKKGLTVDETHLFR